jgi:hypothetical protein
MRSLGWLDGTLPAGVTEYVAHRDGMAARADLHRHAGRLQSRHALPQDYRNTFDSYGKPRKPSLERWMHRGLTKSVRDRGNELDGNSFFKLFAELLKTNPPAAEDAPMVAKLAKIGIVPGQDFDATKLDPAVAKGIAGAPKPAQDKIMGWFKDAVKAGDATFSDGWFFSTKTGTYGTNYIQRALITAIELGANRPQDAVYQTSEVDADGKPYSGEKKNYMHFNKGEMPRSKVSVADVYNGEYFCREPAESLQR